MVGRYSRLIKELLEGIPDNAALNTGTREKLENACMIQSYAAENNLNHVSFDESTNLEYQRISCC